MHRARVLMAVGCAFTGGVLFLLLGANVLHPPVKIDDPADVWMPLTAMCFSVAASLGSMLWITPGRVADETRTVERERRRMNAALAILARVQEASDAADAMAETAKTSPKKLPGDRADDFTRLAAFCYAWRTHEHAHFWTPRESGLLMAANHALFELLLSFEMDKPNVRDIGQKKAATDRALNDVAAAMKMITGP